MCTGQIARKKYCACLQPVLRIPIRIRSFFGHPDSDPVKITEKKLIYRMHSKVFFLFLLPSLSHSYSDSLQPSTRKIQDIDWGFHEQVWEQLAGKGGPCCALGMYLQSVSPLGTSVLPDQTLQSPVSTKTRASSVHLQDFNISLNGTLDVTNYEDKR